MRKLMLMAGVAALAASVPALAQGNGNGNGNGKGGGNHGGGPAKAEKMDRGGQKGPESCREPTSPDHSRPFRPPVIPIPCPPGHRPPAEALGWVLPARWAGSARISVMDYRDRIVIDPQIRFGKPTVRGTRITVGDVLSFLAPG